MRNCVHFCDFSLQIKIAPRKTRSILIPIATPITPISSQSPNRAEKKSLAATVRKTDTTMVNFTSPAARSQLPSEPANGYAKPLKILLISTRIITSSFASGEIAEILTMSGVIMKTKAFHRTDSTRVILFNFLK